MTRPFGWETFPIPFTFKKHISIQYRSLGNKNRGALEEEGRSLSHQELEEYDEGPGIDC